MKVLKFLLIVFIFIYSLIAFFPKEKAFQSLNLYLKKYEVFVDYDKFNDNFLVCDIKKIKIFYKNSILATIDALKVDIFLFDNKLYLKYFITSDEFKNIVPNIKLSKIVFNIKDIFNIKIYANLIGAKLDGAIDLKNRKIIIKLDANKSFKNKYKLIVNYFKKTKKGLIFEYSF